MILPTLYQKASNGKTKIWVIKTDQNKIITEHGYLNFKTIIDTKVISKGKNIGKKNETSPEKQAELEAQSKWNKKIDEGYSENEEGSVSTFPMLAHNYSQRSHNIKFPAFVQPKIDGCRAIYKNGNFFSRNGKRYHNIPFKIDTKTTILDGELYSYEIPFEQLVGIIKKEKVDNNDLAKINSLVFIVYDIIIEKPFHERHKILKSMQFPEQIRILETEECEDHSKIIHFHDKYISQGYEGLIIRNKEGYYKEKFRSPDLQKFKTFEDSEFKIVDYKMGQGLEEGCVIWICENENRQRFSVRPKGTREERRNIRPNEYLNKMLTVRYQNLTEEGIPRFPVGITIRDYE